MERYAGSTRRDCESCEWRQPRTTTGQPKVDRKLHSRPETRRPPGTGLMRPGADGWEMRVLLFSSRSRSPPATAETLRRRSISHLAFSISGWEWSFLLPRAGALVSSGEAESRDGSWGSCQLDWSSLVQGWLATGRSYRQARG